MASATQSNTRLFDHFLGAALDGRFAGVTENSGSVAVSAGVEGGVVAVTTGATSGNRSHIWAGLNWRADRGGIKFEARVEPKSAVTTTAYFIGLTDVGTVENPIELGASQAITSNASNAVGFIFDTDATVDVWYFGGVKGDVDTALGTVRMAGSTVVPVVDQRDVFGITVSPEGRAEFFYNGVFQGAIENAVDPAVLLTPHVGVETRTSAARTVNVDYIDMDGATA